MEKACIILPVREGSNRFPNKIYTELMGKSIIQHMIDIAKAIEVPDKLILVASSENSERMKGICKVNSVEFIHTPEANCGSQKAFFAKMLYHWFDYYITLPTDEPTINPKVLNKVLKKDFNHITTLYCDFYNYEDVLDNKSCKFVVDDDYKVLYASRSVIPASKSGELLPLDFYKKHLGVFIFPTDLLTERALWAENSLSKAEGLEQNMLLGKLYVDYIDHIGFGIDCPEQIEKLENRVKSFRKITNKISDIKK